MPIPPKKMQALIQQSKKKPAFPMKKGKKPEEEEEQLEESENPNPNPKDEEKEEGKDYSQIVEEEAKRVADGDGDEEIMEKMIDFDPEQNPPAWVSDEALWEKAKEAVDPEGEGAKYDQPYAVVAHVYKRMGGEIA